MFFIRESVHQKVIDLLITQYFDIIRNDDSYYSLGLKRLRKLLAMLSRLDIVILIQPGFTAMKVK